MEKQFKKKNEEFSEAQKAYKEQIETHNKTYGEQLKVKNEEFQKLQKDSAKQLEDMNKNCQEQQKQRQEEMESYKKEIAALHEKNIQSAITENTNSLKVNLEMIKQENIRLSEQLESGKTDYTKIIIALILAFIIGFIIAKLV